MFWGSRPTDLCAPYHLVFPELVVIDRHAKREIMKLEEELPNWRTIIDTGTTPGNDILPPDWSECGL